MGNHLLSIGELEHQDIEELLNRARFYQSQSLYQSVLPATFQNRFVANLFLEPSTRTRFSFEVAEKRLGAQVLNFQANVSSLQKGETLYDTFKTLEAQGVDAVVIRLTEEGILKPLSQRLSLKIINAGEGKSEHPTQALLDLYTMKSYFNEIKGLRVAIVGDIKHSRVARSNTYLLQKLGAEIIYSGPQAFIANDLKGTYLPINEAIKQADVVMMLRIQFERQNEGRITSTESYREEYGFTEERLKLLQPHAIILHPAPVNRGVEMDDIVVEHQQSKIFEQIHNGVWIRMATIERALGGDRRWVSSSKVDEFGIKMNGFSGIS